jgi:hypothetical protein
MPCVVARFMVFRCDFILMSITNVVLLSKNLICSHFKPIPNIYIRNCLNGLTNKAGCLPTVGMRITSNVHKILSFVYFVQHDMNPFKLLCKVQNPAATRRYHLVKIVGKYILVQ